MLFSDYSRSLKEGNSNKHEFFGKAPIAKFCKTKHESLQKRIKFTLVSCVYRKIRAFSEKLALFLCTFSSPLIHKPFIREVLSVFLHVGSIKQKF